MTKDEYKRIAWLDRLCLKETFHIILYPPVRDSGLINKNGFTCVSQRDLVDEDRE